VSQSRSAKGTLHPPRTEPTHSEETRIKWLAKAAADYVQPTKANHVIYDAILRLLWPPGHGLPGPYVSERDVREAIDAARATQGLELYQDPFRRMRELQGDEGFKSIVKSGKTYQLQSTEISQKREPRTRPSAKLWRQIRTEHGYCCAKCGQSEPEVDLTPDHRVPRSRGGGGDDLNWQPLCKRCNILKSAACQGCSRLCQTCFWAYPKDFADLEIADVFRGKIRDQATSKGVRQNELLDSILRKHFRD
jgi:5-methylcytosine-specific restriction endonuclease McrA